LLPTIDPGTVELPEITGTPLKSVLPFWSAPIKPVPFILIVAIALFAAKSAMNVAPFVVTDPAELKIWQLAQFVQRNENSQYVSAFARAVAFDDAFPTVSPFAGT